MIKFDESEKTFELIRDLELFEPKSDIFTYLLDRFGEDFLRDRLLYQIAHADKVFNRGRRLLHIENSEWMMVFLYYALKMMGLYERGNRNFKDIQVVENRVEIKGLPAALNGYRILQLTDLHLDIDSELTPIIGELAQKQSFDLLVVTGDYRASTSGSYLYALSETIRLMEYLPKPIYAILGNHDFIEFLPPLEEHAGMTFLVNESIRLEKDGTPFYLIGIDDPHMYQTDNFEKAFANVPQDGIKILLSHSPETFAEADQHGVDLLLAGHTHGGQICLPGGIPIIAHRGAATKEMVNGAWKWGNLNGYTSPGTGGCGVPVRYFCPPEMTIHTLVSV